MMSKSIVKHFSMIGAGTLVSMILGLVTTPIITRVVNTVEYGKYSVFVMYANIAVVVLMVGLDQAYLRYFYKAEQTDENNKLFYRCTFIPFLSAIGLGVLLCVASAIVPQYFEFKTEIMVMLSLYTVSLVLLKQIQLTARLKYKTKVYSSLAVADKAIYIAVVMIAIFGLGCKSLAAIAFSITVAALITVLLGFLILRKDLAFNCGKVSCVNVRELVAYGFPFVFSMGLTVLFQSVDKLCLKIFTDYSDIGVYKSAESMINVFAIIQTTFNALWMPLALKKYEEEPENKKFHKDGNEIITLLMITFGATVIVFKDLLVYWLGPDFREAAMVLPALVFNPVMYTISETTVVGIVFSKKSHLHIVVALVACIANVAGNLLLIPLVGIRGAAISTGFAYVLFFVMRSVLGKKYYSTGAPIGKCIFVAILTFLYALFSMFTNFGILNIVLYSALIICIFTLYKNKVKFVFEYVRNKFSVLKGD